MNGMNPVIIRIRGTQRDEAGETNTIESMAVGRHSVKNGKHYVLYEDAMLHEQQSVSTVLKFSDEEMTLLRKGAMKQEMRFRPGSATVNRYRTPYGDLAMTIRTHRLDVSYGLLEGFIEAEYDIAIDDQHQSTNTLRIEIANDKKKKEG